MINGIKFDTIEGTRPRSVADFLCRGDVRSVLGCRQETYTDLG